MEQKHETPTSVTEWMITIIVSAIPLIGLIMLFIWAFAGEQGSSKSNWAKAALLIYAILIVLGLLSLAGVIGFNAQSTF